MGGMFQEIGYKAMGNANQDNSTNYTSRYTHEEVAQAVNSRFAHYGNLDNRGDYIKKMFDRMPIESGRNPALRIMPDRKDDNYRVIDFYSLSKLKGDYRKVA